MLFESIRSIFTPSSKSNLENTIQRKRMTANHTTNINTAPLPDYVVAELKGSKAPQFDSIPYIKILSKMGDGAFSNVYRGYHTKLGKEVAVKVVQKLQLSSNQQTFIHKEVSILRNCRHDNVVQLYDFVDTKVYYFIIMELVKGGEIFNKIIDHTYFSEPMTRHIINQVAAGIAHLHNTQGVVHRDIKPENILFEPIPIITDPVPYIQQGYTVHQGREGEGYIVEGYGGAGIGKIKIADFGLSKVVLGKSTMTPCGTVGYTAPEIVKDERYSYSVDMWALGCVLYTLLCGFPPFYDEDIHILTEKVAHGYFEFLSPWWDGISNSAKNLVSHLLTVNPAKRYTTDGFFAHPWTRESPKKDREVCKPTPRCMAPPLATPITPSVTLKEAFSVSYAVQIMQDESGVKQNVETSTKPKSRNYQPNNGNLQAISSDSDDELSNQPNTRLFSRGVYEEPSSNLGFNLSLDNASLLGRRKVKVNAITSPIRVAA